MYQEVNPGPTQGLRVLAGLVGIVSIIAAWVIWREMGTVEVPGAMGLSSLSRSELSPVAVAVGFGVLLGGLLLSTACFVLAAISESIAGLREDANPDDADALEEKEPA